MKYALANLSALIFLSLSNFVYGIENIDYHNDIISSWCGDSHYTFKCDNNISIVGLKKDNVSEGNASANDVVEQKHPSEFISFESSKKFIKSLKDILKDEIPKDKIDFTLEPFNASDTGFNYKNIKTLKKALPLGSEEIIRSVKELNIEERSALKKSLQIEIYQTALSRASGESLNEVKKSSSMGKIGLGLLGVGGAIAAGGSSDKPAPLPSLSISTSTSAIAESAGTSTVTVTLSKSVGVDIEATIAYSSTASVDVDFSSSSTVSIPAGETSATFTVTAIDDSVYEGDETSVVTISSIDNSGVNISSSNSVTLTITEDETVPTVSLESSSNSIAEESGNSITFTASIDQVASVDLSVTISTTVNSRSRAYTANLPTSISITIPAGSLSGTATFTPTDNNSYDGTTNVSFAVSSVAGSGAVGNTINIHSSAAAEIIAVTETEVAPTVSLSASSASVAEDGSVITLTATLTGSTYTDTTLVLGGSGTATNTSDYTIENITIAAGETSGTASFTPIEDNLYEGITETAIVSISSVSGGGATESGTQSETITITDADSAPTVTLSSNVTSVAEDGGTGTLTATLSIATTADVTVELSAAGTATSGTDYTSGVTSSITISAGSLTGTASGASIADDIYEGDETAIVSISSVSGGGATENGDQSVTVTIIDAESAPTVALTSSASSVSESSTSNLTLTATLSVAAKVDVVVTLGASGSAIEGTHYASLSNITISAGNTTGTAVFNPTNDNVSGGDKSAIISISSLSGASASNGSPSSVTISIIDDESTPTVTLSSSASTVAENGSDLTLTATLSIASSENVIVTLTGSGTSTSGTDYASLSTITISAGSTSGTTAFNPTGDSVYEGSETAIIAITGVSGGSAVEDGIQSETITITDSLAAPTVTLSSSVSTVAENGTNPTLTATLNRQTFEDVTVTITASGTAIFGTDYTALEQITISAGETTGTITATLVNDSVYEGDETAILNITGVSGGGATENGTQTVTVTLTDSLAAPTATLIASASTVSEKASDLTLTATLNRSTYEAVTVTLSTTGTSTAGTDYESLSSITISAGSTTGTTAFTPKDDNLYENSETAIIAINTVSGGGATESGTQSVTIAITDKALDSGTQATYDANNESTWLNAPEFYQSDYGADNRATDYTPYQNIKLHQALSYEDADGDKKMGSGQVVAIMDSGFQFEGLGSNTSTHIEFDGKTITSENAANFYAYTSSNVHGTAVAGVAAGNFGQGYTMGVAPEASLHLHDYAYNFSPTGWALGTTSAETAGAVVQNNSWGFDQQYGAAGANVFVNYMNNNGLSGSETLVAFQSIDTNSDGYYDIGVSNTPKTWTTNDWDGYISSLDSFQDTGVVVFALSNDDTKTDADISAALPELFSSLQEAWINVANVNISGTTSQTHSLESAPCGSTAEYCLAADGTNIFMPGYTGYTLSGSTYGTATGTSFAAPQVSGSIALLASHFPNHSPEALADRLLASANNEIGFTQTGTVTFGNGVVHGYSNEAGHGILDIYAALQPITSDSYARNQIYAGSSSIGQSAFSLDSTRANLSRSFGDALEIGLANTNTYFYDALDGGFAVGMNDLAFSLNPVKPSLSVKSELSNLTSVSNKFLHFKDTGWSETSDDRKGFFNASVSSSPSALNNFYLNAGAADLGFAAYSMPTLSGIQGGDGFNLGLNMGEGFLTTSFTQTNIIRQFRK